MGSGKFFFAFLGLVKFAPASCPIRVTFLVTFFVLFQQSLEFQNGQGLRAGVDDASLLKKTSYEHGWLDPDQFMKRLEQEGIKDATRGTGSSGSIIHLVRIQSFPEFFGILQFF